jgi:hypothetical protein
MGRHGSGIHVQQEKRLHNRCMAALAQRASSRALPWCSKHCSISGVQDAPDSFGTVIVLLKRGGGSTQWSSGWHTVASRFVDFGVRCPGGRTVLRDLIHVEVTGSQSRGCSDNMFYLYIFLAMAAKEIAGSGSSPSPRY